MDLEVARLDDGLEVGAGVGEISGVEVEVERPRFAGGEPDALEAFQLQDRAGDRRHRVAEEEEDGGGAGARAGVGDGGLDGEAGGEER